LLRAIALVAGLGGFDSELVWVALLEQLFDKLVIRDEVKEVHTVEVVEQEG